VLAGRERELATRALHHLDRERLRADGSEAVVRALDPRRVLERGYSITRDEAGRVVKRAAVLTTGTVLETEVADGRVTSRVEGVTEGTE
jgi:exodeoxyribonuclease VII large subunit